MLYNDFTATHQQAPEAIGLHEITTSILEASLLKNEDTLKGRKSSSSPLASYSTNSSIVSELSRTRRKETGGSWEGEQRQKTVVVSLCLSHPYISKSWSIFILPTTCLPKTCREKFYNLT